MDSTTTHTTSIFMHVLASVLILFAITFFTMLLFIEIPENNIRYIDTIIGFLLGSVVGVIINYYFGASTPTSTSPLSNATVAADIECPPVSLNNTTSSKYE